MKILINGKLVDFSDHEPNKEIEKKKDLKKETENKEKGIVHDQGKEFLDNAHNFNKTGKKGNEDT